MHKIKLFLFFLFQLFIIASGYGQIEITKKGYEEAINYANYKYVAFSLTNTEEKQKFIEDCDCDKNPTALAIQNAIPKRKTKTIAFSKELNKLKGVNIDLNQKKIASFLTDSIFSKRLSSNYIRIFNYGKSRKENQRFISFKNDLYKSLLKIMDDYTIDIPITAKATEEKVVARSKNNTLLVNEISEFSQYNPEEPNWYDSFLSQINVVSIIISVLLSLIIIGYLYYKYVRNVVSNSIKKYVTKKISGLSFDERFNRNQAEINNLKSEIIELKVFIQKMFEQDESNNPT